MVGIPGPVKRDAPRREILARNSPSAATWGKSILKTPLIFALGCAKVCFRIGGNMKKNSRIDLKRLASVLLVLVALFAFALVVVNFMSPQVSGGARFGTDYTVVIGNVEYFDCHGIARNCVVVWP
jgi:hypothetical protein